MILNSFKDFDKYLEETSNSNDTSPILGFNIHSDKYDTLFIPYSFKGKRFHTKNKFYSIAIEKAIELNKSIVFDKIGIEIVRSERALPRFIILSDSHDNLYFSEYISTLEVLDSLDISGFCNDFASLCRMINGSRLPRFHSFKLERIQDETT